MRMRHMAVVTTLGSMRTNLARDVEGCLHTDPLPQILSLLNARACLHQLLLRGVLTLTAQLDVARHYSATLAQPTLDDCRQNGA